MAKHTPGPWHIERDDLAGFVEIWQEHGHRIALIDEDDYPEEGYEEEVEANAHLLAAAPDLLEASRDMLAALEREFGTIGPERSVYAEQYARLKAAIQKAEP